MQPGQLLWPRRRTTKMIRRAKSDHTLRTSLKNDWLCEMVLGPRHDVVNSGRRCSAPWVDDAGQGTFEGFDLWVEGQPFPALAPRCLDEVFMRFAPTDAGGLL